MRALRRRADLAVVQLPVDVDLALRDVAREVGDGVGDVIVGHCRVKVFERGVALVMTPRVQRCNYPKHVLTRGSNVQ